jgi:hypothetical protein
MLFFVMWKYAKVLVIQSAGKCGRKVMLYQLRELRLLVVAWN